MDYFKWQLAKEIENLVVDYGMDLQRVIEKAIGLLREEEGGKVDFT